MKTFHFAKNNVVCFYLKSISDAPDWWPRQAGDLQDNMPLKACNAFYKSLLLLL